MLTGEIPSSIFGFGSCCSRHYSGHLPGGTRGMRMRLSVVLVAGGSMRAALRPGDRLLVASGVRVSAGDVVLFRLPDSDVLAVKRAAFRQDGGWWLESDNQSAPGRRD